MYIQCGQSIVCLRLSALVSWARLCVSNMLDACMTTDSYIRAVICHCTAYWVFVKSRDPGKLTGYDAACSPQH